LVSRLVRHAIIIAIGLSCLAALAFIGVNLRSQRSELAQYHAELQQYRGELARYRNELVLDLETPRRESRYHGETQPADERGLAAGAHRAPTEVTAASPVSDESQAPSEEQRHATAEVRRIADEALGRGRITKADVQEMRRQMAMAGSSPEVHEALRRIAVGLNTRQLTPEDPLFMAP
jgi:hypothetical protein